MWFHQGRGSLRDWGACAQYKCLPKTAALVKKPTNLTDEEVAGICEGALTALPFLRDEAGLRPGQRVLINGASGGIGSIAVQLAKYFGAHVTGVCSGANLELVSSLGADRVIDYTQEDFTLGDESYDVIFDTVGKSSFFRCRAALRPQGIYLTTVPSLTIMLQMLGTSMLSKKRAIFAAAGKRTCAEKVKDLDLVKRLVESGAIKPVVDRRYRLEQLAEAHRYVEKGHKRGSVVVTVPHDDATVN